MRKLICLLSILSAILILPGAPAAAQAPVISVLTCRPGSEVYQLEGHTGLRILDSIRGFDVTVNWGVFDFNSPNFIYRFVKGETDYMCASVPTDYFLREYVREGREVAEQVLDLTPAEAERVMMLVSANLEPQNRVYRYNYVLDNCATRPLAIIQQAIGDTLSLAHPARPEARATFREVMTAFHDHYPWYQFGIDTALGSGIDRPITTRELAFAPELLHDMLASAARPDGTPIVRESSVLIPARSGSVVLPPTPQGLHPLTWSCLVMVICGAAALFHRGAFFRTVSTVYYTVAFLAGLVLTFLIFVSVHEATSPNWLYLWINPLCIVPAVGVWIKKYKRLVVYYQIVNFALLIALAVVWTTGIQKLNPAFLPLIAADIFLGLPWLAGKFNLTRR